MKISREMYRRLAELERSIPKLVDHTVALLFVEESQASYLSIDGRDQEIYSVFRDDGEAETEFQKRAEMQTRQKFPKAKLTFVSHQEFILLPPVIDPHHMPARVRESETSRRYCEKMRKDMESHRARRASQSLSTDNS